MVTEQRWRESVVWSCERIAGRSDRPVSGCTPGEIAALEEGVRHTLPAAYRLFLGGVGKLPGDFLVGTQLGYDKLGFLQECWGLVMSEAGASPPASAFCFASNPSYVFLWFSTDVGDDPPVHLYEEGWVESKDTGLTFSRWLEQTVTEQWGVVR